MKSERNFPLEHFRIDRVIFFPSALGISEWGLTLVKNKINVKGWAFWFVFSSPALYFTRRLGIRNIISSWSSSVVKWFLTELYPPQYRKIDCHVLTETSSYVMRTCNACWGCVKIVKRDNRKGSKRNQKFHYGFQLLILV